MKNYNKDNYKLLAIILVLLLLLFTELSIKNYIIIISAGVYIFINYELLNNESGIKYNNNTELENILKNKKKYKKYNVTEYKKGKKVIKNILFVLKNTDKYKHKNYQYDNLKFNISNCLKHYNNMMLSIPSNKYIDYVNYKELKNNYSEFSSLCKKLNDLLYRELYKFGKNAVKENSIHSNYISNDIVEAQNFYDPNNIY